MHDRGRLGQLEQLTKEPLKPLRVVLVSEVVDRGLGGRIGFRHGCPLRQAARVDEGRIRRPPAIRPLLSPSPSL